jgi:hypothetical protein
MITEPAIKSLPEEYEKVPEQFREGLDANAY